MSELNACFGRFQMQQWDRDEQRRMSHYETLWNALRGLLSRCDVYPPPVDSGSAFVFPITLNSDRLDEVQQALAARGVECRSLMGGAINRHPAYRSIPHDGLVNCHRMGSSSFFVGIHQSLPDEDVRAVAEILRDVIS